MKYNGIVLTKEELWISHYLLAGYGRTAEGIWYRLPRTGQAAVGMPAYQSHNHEIDNDYTDR